MTADGVPLYGDGSRVHLWPHYSASSPPPNTYVKIGPYGWWDTIATSSTAGLRTFCQTKANSEYIFVAVVFFLSVHSVFLLIG